MRLFTLHILVTTINGAVTGALTGSYFSVYQRVGQWEVRGEGCLHAVPVLCCMSCVYVSCSLTLTLMLPPFSRKRSSFRTTLTDLLRKAPRAVFSALDKLFFLLVNCMCRLLC